MGVLSPLSVPGIWWEKLDDKEGGRREQEEQLLLLNLGVKVSGLGWAGHPAVGVRRERGA